MKKPKFYKPQPGDEFIRIRDISSKHRGRIFEARNQRNGEGILGELEDANHYLLNDVVGIRFKDQELGLFDHPDAMILLKPEGFRIVDMTQHVDEDDETYVARMKADYPELAIPGFDET